MNNYQLSIVIPVYNEENNIRPLTARLKEVIADLQCRYEIIFIMDPCSDLTEKMIMELRENDRQIKLLKTSRRFGQPACTQAGIFYCSGDICVVLDADLQDPPELIKAMVEKWQEGYQVVYAQRISRKGDFFVKKIVAYLAYWFINKIAEVKIPRNTGDFRLISRVVINELKKLRENDGYLRGLVAYVGFNQTAVMFDREVRFSGKGKYHPFFGGSLRIALNGLLSFSKKPLHFIGIMGIFITVCSFIFGIGYPLITLINHNNLQIDFLLIIVISFFSGIQLLSIGIIGQYFARIYDEIKGRPNFIIHEAYGFDDIIMNDKKIVTTQVQQPE